METPRPGVDAAAATVERLFALHERRLGAFLVQLVRDRQLAEDILQETFASAFRDRERLETVENTEAWLFGIARHRAMDAMRASRRLRIALTRLAARREPVVMLEPAAVEVLDVLERVLSPDDRVLIVLRYVHGFDATTLAVITGRSPAAIRKRLERSCARLAEEVVR